MSIVIAGVAGPIGAVAQSEGLYISGGVGGVLAADSEIEGGAINTEARFGLGASVLLAVGLTLGKEWRAEAELAFRTANVDELSGAVNGDGRISGITLLLNGYRDFTLDSNWTPYVGAGIGLARLNMDDVSPIGSSRIDDSDWVAAAQVIAGIGYRLNERLGLYTDYRFLATTKPEFTTVAGTKVESEYSEHRIMIGLRWSFGGAKPQPAPAPASVKTPEPAPVPAPLEAKNATAPAPPKAPEMARRFLLFFDWDRSSLTDEARAIVRKAAEASTQASVTLIEATGHADRSGPDRYNMDLSRRRAETVKAELNRLGVPVEQIVILHKGEGQPLAVTADGVRELRNRRVEIILK